MPTDMPTDSLSRLRNEKANLEERLLVIIRDETARFHRETGLPVKSINVAIFDTTTHSDSSPMFIVSSVECSISIPGINRSPWD